MLATAGADRIMTVDLHTAQGQGFFDGLVDHLRAQPMLAKHILARYAGADFTVVAPDSGRVRLAETWAELLDAPMAIIQRRDTLEGVHKGIHTVVGDVEGRLCVVVDDMDDMIDTGATVIDATKLLPAEGATEVVTTATHAVLSGDAAQRIAACGIKEVVLTDTVPIPDSSRFPQLTVLPIAPLLADAIQAVFDDDSVEGLFALFRVCF